MRIGIIGASGREGGCLAREALDRGHAVTALVRNRAKITDPRMAVIERDIFALTGEDIAGLNVLIDAFRPPAGLEEQHITSLEHLTDIVQPFAKLRLMVVGGAGSLFIDAAKTTQLMDSPGFPATFLPTASAMAKAFDILKNSAVNWTYLSPAAEFDPEGVRTGFYALGGDILIANRKGESYVSYADYAVAMIDEAEKAAHIRQRFTVVSEREKKE